MSQQLVYIYGHTNNNIPTEFTMKIEMLEGALAIRSKKNTYQQNDDECDRYCTIYHDKPFEVIHVLGSLAAKGATFVPEFNPIKQWKNHKRITLEEEDGVYGIGLTEDEAKKAYFSANHLGHKIVTTKVAVSIQLALDANMPDFLLQETITSVVEVTARNLGINEKAFSKEVLDLHHLIYYCDFFKDPQYIELQKFCTDEPHSEDKIEQINERTRAFAEFIKKTSFMQLQAKRRKTGS